MTCSRIFRETRCSFSRQELFLNGSEGKEGFAHRERQCWTYFQDCESTLY